MSFISNLNWRYATKKFDEAKKVSEGDLSQILEAIRLAPTSFGLQPFHVSVITNVDLRQKLQEKAWNQPQITTASHLLVFSARTDIDQRVGQYIDVASGGVEEEKLKLKEYEVMLKGFSGQLVSAPGDKALNWAAKQAYIALGFGLAAAEELSIDSCPMEGFDGAAFKVLLGLTDNLNPVVLLPIGYRASDEQPRSKVRFSNDDLFNFVA